MEKTVFDALNEQINFEFYSGYIYLQAGLAMEKANYKGYSKWLIGHYQEELDHAKQFIDYMLKRDATPALTDIHVEPLEISEPLDVARLVLEHEKKVTARIYKIHDISKKADDYATEIFMHQFISEQIEEEDITKEIFDSFTLAGDSVAAKLAVDRSLEA